MNRHSYFDEPPWRIYQQRTASLCVTLILVSLFMSCSFINRYSLHSGIYYEASRGNPPADKLIWSRTNVNKILVTASDYGSGSSQVFTLDISTGEKKINAETDYGFIDAETWSPDDSKVILDIDPATKGYENTDGLWIWDAQENTSVEFLGERGLAIWSPTGNSIAIFDSSNEHEVLHLIEVETKNKKSVTIGDSASFGEVVGADWSPDGMNLVLAIGNPRLSIDQNLFIYSIEGSLLKRLTNEGDVHHPVWSPLGDRIAYVRHARGEGSDSLHLISTNGSCDTEIPGIDWIQSPTWSPDGKKLAFIGSDGIYTLELDKFSKENTSSSLCQ